MKFFRELVVISTLLLLTACTSNSVSPTFNNDPDILSDRNNQSNSQIWGFYEIEIDQSSGTATATPMRTVDFTSNITTILNKTPANLSLTFNGTSPGVGFVDVDLDVSITHPFTGLNQFDGYDVMGVFMGNGSGTLSYNSALKYPLSGSDQVLLNPDGYTRWFNATEFTTSGMFGYTPGVYASTSYMPTGTLNPYKYFADGLTASGNLATFLQSTGDHGVFTAGSVNSRNYVIRFPLTGELKFAYAIVASWEALDPLPNQDESILITANTTDDIVYNGPGDFTGSLIADITVYDWNAQPASGVVEEYILKIESSVLSSVYTASTGDMTPKVSGDNFQTFNLEIPADSVTGIDGNFFWVFAEYPGTDYSSPFGVPNIASGQLVAANVFPLNVSEGVTGQVVSMTPGSAFDPKNITVSVGEQVTWINNAILKHTATTDNPALIPGGPNSDLDFPLGLANGDEYVWTCPDVSSGTVWYYHCRFHAIPGDGTSPGTGMVGSVTVQ